MTFRITVLLCGALWAAQALDRPVSGQAGKLAPRRPNVLFIVADDLRANFGDPSARTPNLKRLAQRGVSFNHAYVQYPVCNPSRVSFLTGLRPETTGILGNATYFRTKLPEIVTLPQLFRQNGYFSASLGKIFHRGLTMEDTRADWADDKVVLAHSRLPSDRDGDERRGPPPDGR
jgi:uncharacterized sulfatase